MKNNKTYNKLIIESQTPVVVYGDKRVPAPYRSRNLAAMLLRLLRLAATWITGPARV